MYEINIHNLKLYLLVSSIIFILTNGLPLLNMFEINKYKEAQIQHNQDNNNIKGDNFIIVNNNYYDVNATVVKHSMMYNTKTEYFTGSIMLKYTNYIDTHQFCKIDIHIEDQKRNDIIYDFMYKYYNLSRNNIKLNCNSKKCIHNLTTYEDYDVDNDNDNYNNNKTVKEIICNILTIKQINDEF